MANKIESDGEKNIQLNLDELMGDVVMTTSPGVVVHWLIEKAANNEIPSESEKAFIKGAAKAIQRKSSKPA